MMRRGSTLRDIPRENGTIQKVQNWSHPSCSFRNAREWPARVTPRKLDRRALLAQVGDHHALGSRAHHRAFEIVEPAEADDRIDLAMTCRDVSGLACARHPVMTTRALGLSRRARRAMRRLSRRRDR